MVKTDPRRTVERWVDAWNRGDPAELASFHPPAFMDNGRETTPADAVEWHRSMRAVYPDLRYELDELFAHRDHVAMRWTARGTHRGRLWGLIPPTGKEIVWRGIHLLRVQADQIVEIWALADVASILSQVNAQVVASPARTQEAEE